MKAVKISLIVFVTSLLVWGCHSQTKKESHKEHEAHMVKESISLNNGEKWLVNEEMKPFILEAETILKEFMANGSTDYQTLAEQLKEKNSGLIKSCTMKGESHDELHKWLEPHMNLIKALGKEKNAEEAQSLVVKLNKSFETYHNYFQ